MSHDVFDKNDLMEIRKNLAIQRNSGGYGYWTQPESKRYKVVKPMFSKEDQEKLDSAKEKINLHYDDDYEDPFF